MIQQSPTERARAINVLASVTARMAPAGEYVARDIRAGNLTSENERAIAAMIEFASQAAQPAEADGCNCGIGDQSDIGHYHESWCAALATPKAPATDAGKVAVPSEQLGRWLIQAIGMFCALHGDDESEPMPSFLREMEDALATPPAPNDDLRAALEDKGERLIAELADAENVGDDEAEEAWHGGAAHGARRMLGIALAALKDNHRG